MTTLQPPSARPGPIGPGHPANLPSPRGPVTEHLLAHLVRPVHELSPVPLTHADPLTDDDLALALYLCYELHYLGLPDVDEAWEWEPIAAPRAAAPRARPGTTPGRADRGRARRREPRRRHRRAPRPGFRRRRAILSSHMLEQGTLQQMREFAVHRSAYQLKEADPHTWGIPRLTGRAKAALVDIQRGEYGDGDPRRVHANLFGEVMAALDLDPTYGAYVDRLPGITLSTCNVVSLFGLHRRWRGALVGHLALFEMCSVGPMGRYQEALERMGFGPSATRFYEEHVIADERHQVVALHDLVAGLVDQEPFLGGEVVFGARALAEVERQMTRHLLDAWAAGRSSLRRPLR